MEKGVDSEMQSLYHIGTVMDAIPISSNALVLPICSIRLILAIAAQHPEWGISSMDVITAFLNALMDKEEMIYARPPALLIHFRLVKPTVRWRMDRALYGLRKTPRRWGKREIKR